MQAILNHYSNTPDKHNRNKCLPLYETHLDPVRGLYNKKVLTSASARRLCWTNTTMFVQNKRIFLIPFRRNKGKLSHITCELFSIIIEIHQTNVNTANASPFMKPALTQWEAYITKRFWPVCQQEDFVEPTQPCLYRTNGSSW